MLFCDLSISPVFFSFSFAAAAFASSPRSCTAASFAPPPRLCAAASASSPGLCAPASASSPRLCATGRSHSTSVLWLPFFFLLDFTFEFTIALFEHVCFIRSHSSIGLTLDALCCCGFLLFDVHFFWETSFFDAVITYCAITLLWSLPMCIMSFASASLLQRKCFLSTKM